VNSERTRFYRDKINGKFMGVCAGIADYTGVDPLWVRLGFIGLVMLGAPMVIPAYFLVGRQEARASLHRPAGAEVLARRAPIADPHRTRSARPVPRYRSPPGRSRTLLRQQQSAPFGRN
jgi:phage shock protein PspC (stress-responsive transcriptional regulator)